mgnify:CR=1 FL=1
MDQLINNGLANYAIVRNVKQNFSNSMDGVKPKKHLGQHFLNDLNIADQIVRGLFDVATPDHVLEIGPGMGVLSDIIIQDHKTKKLVLMDLDDKSIDYLHQKYTPLQATILHEDFLKCDVSALFSNESYSIIGNFPYNISSQIFFNVLDNKDNVDLVVGMLQKEVAERIASKEGNKTYGILSVLLQAYYDIEYLFTVPPEVFNPPPKVQSGVIRLTRNKIDKLPCDEKLFKRVVKQGFQQRRKTLRNALKSMGLPEAMSSDDLLTKRAEQLSVQDFIDLTNKISNNG